MNTQLVENFKSLAEREKTADKPNTFKIRSHLKVAKIIKELKFEITDSSQVKDISGIGTKTLQKIDEFLESGKLKSLEGFSTSENESSVSESKLLEGVELDRLKVPKKLVDDGHTLNSLRKMFSEADAAIYDILTHHQLLGIKYYEDLLQRIPYDEITKVDTYLNKIITLGKYKIFQTKSI